MKYLKYAFLLATICLIIFYGKDISNYIIENFIYYSENIHISSSNDYKLNYSFKYLKNNDEFKVTNKKELIDAMYTILNNGIDEFYFYCDYKECKDDVNKIANDDNISFINNFVHPYNSFKKIYITMNSFNKITVKFEKTYSKEEITLIDYKIDQITSKIINDNMSNKEKIIAFHDYIIDNTKYDSDYINQNLDDINSPSHKATGVLFYNKALCGGYADIMSIFLNKLNIPNFLVASDYHVWNAVYLDDNWYHLDLTWDDPPVVDGSDIRLDKFLLITDNQLSSYNTSYHDFDRNIYLEFNGS